MFPPVRKIVVDPVLEQKSLEQVLQKESTLYYKRGGTIGTSSVHQLNPWTIDKINQHYKIDGELIRQELYPNMPEVQKRVDRNFWARQEMNVRPKVNGKPVTGKIGNASEWRDDANENKRMIEKHFGSQNNASTSNQSTNGSGEGGATIITTVKEQLEQSKEYDDTSVVAQKAAAVAVATVKAPRKKKSGGGVRRNASLESSAHIIFPAAGITELFSNKRKYPMYKTDDIEKYNDLETYKDMFPHDTRQKNIRMKAAEKEMADQKEHDTMQMPSYSPYSTLAKENIADTKATESGPGLPTVDTINAIGTSGKNPSSIATPRKDRRHNIIADRMLNPGIATVNADVEIPGFKHPWSICTEEELEIVEATDFSERFDCEVKMGAKMRLQANAAFARPGWKGPLKESEKIAAGTVLKGERGKFSPKSGSARIPYYVKEDGISTLNGSIIPSAPPEQPIEIPKSPKKVSSRVRRFLKGKDASTLDAHSTKLKQCAKDKGVGGLQGITETKPQTSPTSPDRKTKKKMYVPSVEEKTPIKSCSYNPGRMNLAQKINREKEATRQQTKMMESARENNNGIGSPTAITHKIDDVPRILGVTPPNLSDLKKAREEAEMINYTLREEPPPRSSVKKTPRTPRTDARTDACAVDGIIITNANNHNHNNVVTGILSGILPTNTPSTTKVVSSTTSVLPYNKDDVPPKPDINGTNNGNDKDPVTEPVTVNDKDLITTANGIKTALLIGHAPGKYRQFIYDVQMSPEKREAAIKKLLESQGHNILKETLEKASNQTLKFLIEKPHRQKDSDYISKQIHRVNARPHEKSEIPVTAAQEIGWLLNTCEPEKVAKISEKKYPTFVEKLLLGERSLHDQYKEYDKNEVKGISRNFKTVLALTVDTVKEMHRTLRGEWAEARAKKNPEGIKTAQNAATAAQDAATSTQAAPVVGMKEEVSTRAPSTTGSDTNVTGEDSSTARSTQNHSKPRVHIYDFRAPDKIGRYSKYYHPLSRCQEVISVDNMVKKTGVHPHLEQKPKNKWKY